MDMLLKILRILSVGATGTIRSFIKEFIRYKHICIALLATIVLSFSFISLSSVRIHAEPVHRESLYAVNTETTICPPVPELISTSTSVVVSQNQGTSQTSRQPLNIISLIPKNTIDVNPQQEEEKTGIWTKIKDYFKDPDWLLVGLIIAAVVVVILTIIVLTRRQDIPETKGKPSEQPQTVGGQQPAGRQQPMERPQMMGGQQSLTCPSCGAQNPPDRKFCASCGTNLAARPQQGTPPTPQMVTCPSCGTSNPPDRKFCGNCGTNLAAKAQKPTAAEAPRETVCTQCGTANPPGRKFCGNCGNSLLAGTQQQQAPQAPQDVICVSCGTLNPSGRKFCGNCGEALMAAGTYQQYSTGQSFSCPICGATIHTGMNPCPNCKTWLDWG
jgi:DNA-directed RNA polymerase subunit M/transcription elongation factor TFIIS